jgi:type VI secretion system protein VasG
MNVVPFVSLDRDAMASIARLKLAKVDRRLRDAHGVRFDYTDDVVQRIADRCTEVDAGARNIDAIIDRTVLPAASRVLLTRLADENLPEALVLGLDDAGDFTYAFHEVGATPATDDEAAAPARKKSRKKAEPVAESVAEPVVDPAGDDGGPSGDGAALAVGDEPPPAPGDA